MVSASSVGKTALDQICLRLLQNRIENQIYIRCLLTIMGHMTWGLAPVRLWPCGKGFFGTPMSALGPTSKCLFNFVNIYQLDLVKNEIEFCILQQVKNLIQSRSSIHVKSFFTACSVILRYLDDDMCLTFFHLLYVSILPLKYLS